MSLQRYEEALACGLDKRDAGLVAVAGELVEIFCEQREREEAFAADIGYTVAELRAMPVEDHPFIQELYSAWRESEGR